MQNPFKDIDKEITVAEHASIIQNYRKTRFLDRDNAIKKYTDFNKKYPDFHNLQKSAGIITNNFIKFEDATNDVIAENLHSQILWLVGADYLKQLCI